MIELCSATSARRPASSGTTRIRGEGRRREREARRRDGGKGVVSRLLSALSSGLVYYFLKSSLVSFTKKTDIEGIVEI